MPRASFIGHLSGIILGYPLSWGLLSYIPPALLASLLALVVIIHERLLPWQTSNLPSQASRGGGNKPPQSLVRPFTITLAAQCLLSFISLVGLDPPFLLEHTILAFLGLCALRVFPTSNIEASLNTLYYYLCLAAFQTAIDVMSLGGLIARGRLYHQMGVSGVAISGGIVVLVLVIMANVTGIITALWLVHSFREGYDALQSIGIELEVPSSTNGSGGTTSFSGSGNVLGGTRPPPHSNSSPTRTAGVTRPSMIVREDGKSTIVV